MARYYMRNPQIPTVSADLYTKGVAVATGVYLNKNVGAILSSFLPSVANSVDGIRPGLSTGAMEVIGAVIIGMVAPRLPLLDMHSEEITLGSVAIAASDVISSVIGQVNLIGGSPNFSSRVSGMGGGMSGMSMAAPAKALPAAAMGITGASGNSGTSNPAFSNMLSTPQEARLQSTMSTAQLLGTGTMGF